ncbi:hypothetical protein J4410_05640 [Candidatus Woesearchaeota archaeon]|nr:hypothetical protein [Candidatus Woesearchaeota archaeon]
MAAWGMSNFEVTKWYHFTAVLSSILIIAIIFLELTVFRKWIFGIAILLGAFSLLTWWQKDRAKKNLYPTGAIGGVSEGKTISKPESRKK